MKNKAKKLDYTDLRVIVSGGGTGGHIFPAITIADEVRAIEQGTDLLFVGAKGKMEMQKVPNAGYTIKGLWISGFNRKKPLKNILFPLKLVISLLKSWYIIWKYRPDVAVGVGGFASGPLLYMATLKGIPTLIQEQNSYPGITNRLLANRVDKVCVAYPGMERFFPSDRIVFTGNPVRRIIQNSDAERKSAAEYFGFKADRPIIFVMGGSLGAKSMNKAMAANTQIILDNPQLQILWQYGELYKEDYADCATAQLENVRAEAFISQMDQAYAMADVIICRAGALTIAELYFAGKPTILIPSPNVAEDHQTKNAMALVEAEAAILLKDKDAETQIMTKAIALLENESLKQKLATNIAKLVVKNAGVAIAKEVIKLGKDATEEHK